MEKIVKQNGISPKKDFYTYVNFAWMKQQDIVMDYKNYYFIKLDNFRFVQNTVNYRIIRLANEYCDNNNTPHSKKVKNVLDSMKLENMTFDKISKHVDNMKIDYEKYVKYKPTHETRS